MAREHFASDVSSVGAVRAYVRGFCEGSDLTSAEVALVVMVASELAANAVRHGRTSFEVSLDRGAVDVRVGVRDDCPTEPVVPQRTSSFDPSGRGMQIVDRVASAWGVAPEVGVGKTVWATIAVAPN